MNQEKKNELAKWLLDPDKIGVDLRLDQSRLRGLIARSSAKADDLGSDWNFLEKKLESNSLIKVFEEIELPLAPILDEMKNIGIKIDKNNLEKLSHKLILESEKIKKEIYKKINSISGSGELNLNSPKQLSEFLFNKPPHGLGLESRGIIRNKRGNFRVDVNTLIALRDQHPAIPLILKYREIFKIKSTYILPFLELMDKNFRIHTTFLQTGTATGRLSSRDPNLQNIPPEIRYVFVPEEKFTLVAFDYSQIELRVLASVSSDEKMIEAFKNNIDIHSLTASQILNKDIKKITDKERTLAKTLNFGIVYGMGRDAFASRTGLSREEAQRFINEYFSNFKEIKRFQEKIIDKARQLGYVENLNGRKRWLPDIVSFSFKAEKEAERAAINMPIQGLAADILKLAMIGICNLLQEKKMCRPAFAGRASPPGAGMDKVRLLLTIHDELLFEISDDILQDVIPFIKEEMEGAYKLNVPLVVNVSFGKNWGEL